MEQKGSFNKPHTILCRLMDAAASFRSLSVMSRKGNTQLLHFPRSQKLLQAEADTKDSNSLSPVRESPDEGVGHGNLVKKQTNNKQKASSKGCCRGHWPGIEKRANDKSGPPSSLGTWVAGLGSFL